MIALLVMTDGRKDCIARTIPSAFEHLDGPITELIVHDDSGDPEYRQWLRGWLEQWGGDVELQIKTTTGRRGFGAAVRSAWAYTAARSSARYVFHLEDDFTFNRPVDLRAMMDVLDRNPYIAQLALRRQAWNPAEVEAGGVVEQHPDAYDDVCDDRGRCWLEHRLFFSTNPSLFRRSMLSCDWPAGEHSEGKFTHWLLSDGTPEVAGPAVRFAYWGKRSDDPWVEHIGHERAGTGY